LKPREASLLTALTDNRDRWGETRLTMEELTKLTGSSRTTLWRALSILTERGLVETTRTKRNLGRLYKNRYRVIKFETSTVGQGSLDSLTTVTDSHIKNTSYSFGAEGTEEEPMVNNWKEEDDFMSFGLIEEAPLVQKISKADPKTRRLRSQDEWTALDVASEFAFRVYDNIRGVPGIVNTMNLRGALSRNRNKFDINAAIEMSLMDKFFADARNIAAIKRSPKNAIGIFLNFITNNITSARNEVTIEQALAMAEELEYLYASDGRKFDKSIAGRAALARYEKKLRGE
jgi:predicted transcriptional regulator